MICENYQSCPCIYDCSHKKEHEYKPEKCYHLCKRKDGIAGSRCIKTTNDNGVPTLEIPTIRI
jgi:hypothetical protein